MVYQGVYADGRSFLLNQIEYYVMAYRQGDEYCAVWECCKCGYDEYQDAASSRDCKMALGAAGELAEQHHGRMHQRSEKAKAASRVAMKAAAR